MSIEELITRGLPLNQTLRLLVLHSLVAGGIKAKSFDPIRREILQVYGYDKLPFLLALDKAGLLVRQSSASSAPKPLFPTLRKQLRLVVDDAEDPDSDDISFAYSGYAPLSVRLVQCVAQKGAVLSAPAGSEAASARPKAHPIVGWKGFEDVLSSGSLFRVPAARGANRQTLTSCSLRVPPQVCPARRWTSRRPLTSRTCPGPVVRRPADLASLYFARPADARESCPCCDRCSEGADVDDRRLLCRRCASSPSCPRVPSETSLTLPLPPLPPPYSWQAAPSRK